MTATSANVAPAPPNCSGTSSPTQPASTSTDHSTVAILGEQVARHGSEFFVELLEFVCHQATLGSRGSPRPRSAMMVRWISLEPPGIVHSHEPMKSSTQEPDSHPLDIGLANSVCAFKPADLGAEIGEPLQQFAVVELDDRRVGGAGGSSLVVLHQLRGTARAAR